jgi:hypothetical protein
MWGYIMKRVLLAFFVVILMALLSGCPNLAAGTDHPVLQHSARWVSSDPDLWFDVHLDDENHEGHQWFYGEMSINGNAMDIQIGISVGSGPAIIGGGKQLISFYTTLSGWGFFTLFDGECNLNENENLLGVRITHYGNTWPDGFDIFDRSIERLIFVRHEFEEETE